MTTGQIVGTVDSLRRSIAGRETGLVPTMGALHEGHASLIRRAALETELVVVSIFVNPTQFNDPADLAKYPRDLPADAEAAFSAGANVVYAPGADVVYPTRFSTAVDVAGLDACFEGAARPGHFRGVATVVSILMNSVQPARSYFGEKDFQQLAIVRQMHRDLVLPGKIVGCETVRDADGLALSSRNRRLTPPGRHAASAIPGALRAIQQGFAAGERSTERLLEQGSRVVGEQPALSLDYLAIVDPLTLEPIDEVDRDSRILFAAIVDGVRLIDNAAVGHAITPPRLPS